MKILLNFEKRVDLVALGAAERAARGAALDARPGLDGLLVQRPLHLGVEALAEVLLREEVHLCDKRFDSNRSDSTAICRSRASNGPFSTLSKPTLTTKYALESSRRDLLDLQFPHSSCDLNFEICYRFFRFLRPEFAPIPRGPYIVFQKQISSECFAKFIKT